MSLLATTVLFDLALLRKGTLGRAPSICLSRSTLAPVSILRWVPGGWMHQWAPWSPASHWAQLMGGTSRDGKAEEC